MNYKKAIYYRIGFSFISGKGKAIAQLFLIAESFEEVYKMAPDAAMFMIMTETSQEKSSMITSGDTISGLEITTIEQIGPVMIPTEISEALPTAKDDPELIVLEQLLQKMREKKK